MTLCVAPHDNPRESLAPSLLCRSCCNQLPRKLRQLADLHDELAANLTQTGGGGERVAMSMDAVGLDLNPTVVNLRHAIKNELAGWARLMLEDRAGFNPPADNVHAIAAFVATHATWYAQQDFIGDLWLGLFYDPLGRRDKARDTRGLMTQARSLLQPSKRRRMDIDQQCLDVNCGGLLIALGADVDELLPPKVWCERCGAQWAPDEWMTLGRKIRESAAG